MEPASSTAQAWEGEDRRAPRHRVLLTGVVAHDDLGVSFRCSIRDRSSQGARLRLPDGILAPSEFRMIDVAEGYAYEATTKWRRYPELGVALANPINLRTAWFDGWQRQLRALWLEAAPRR
jgi:hypothetical protein